MEEEASSKATEAVLETLRSRGWCIRDFDQLRALVIIQTALSDDDNPSAVANSVESELLNMDIRSFGAKNLPDPSLLKKTSYLQGPKVFQISSVRDLSVSSTENFSESSIRRLLRFVLTDGHCEITAIEYAHIPCNPNDIVPGAKVRLENKAPIHSDIVCLNPKIITLMGGVVKSLYEEWQMNQKYSGLSRSLLRLSQETDNGGPPPFEKLKIGAPNCRSPLQSRFSDYSQSAFKSSVTVAAVIAENTEIRPLDTQEGADVSTEEKPSNSETRPKEVAESVPVQNQAASQKLLQKMSHPNQGGQHFRGRRNKGKNKQDEDQLITLEEWEKRKAGAKPPMKNEYPDTSRDEDLAWRLQNQLDVEDSHVQMGLHNTVADDLRMSMFSYGREKGYEMENSGRGRGRGGGRGGGRGRDRRRGRGRW